MKISVIIPSYFKNSYERTLKSVLSQTHNNFEVLVVKNGEGNKKYYSKGNLKIYEIPKPGLDNARNFGIRASTGDIIAFIDDDAVATKNWLSSIVKSHMQFSAPAIGGKVLPRWPKNKKPKWIKGILLDYLSILDKTSNTPNAVHPLDWLAGTNITFKKYIFNKVGYFDENLDRKEFQLLSSGEVELCSRIRNKGYQIIFDPSISVWHVIPESRLTPQYFIDRAYWQGVSSLLIDKKHLTRKDISKKFEQINLEIQYENLNPKAIFESVSNLCKYANAIGYLQAYISHFSL